MSTYVCSDIHGKYNLWNKIKRKLKDSDRLVFLGDAADRGLNGYTIIKEILADPRITYIKGNHEDLLVKGMRTSHYGIRYSDDFNLWMYNGGGTTFDEMTEDIENDKVTSVIYQLADLPVTCEYTNKDGIHIYMSHAGFTLPDVPELEDILLWDREHILNKPSNIENSLIIHGHTPSTHIQSVLDNRAEFYHLPIGKDYTMLAKFGPIWYCNEEKLDMDCQSAYTNHIAMIDLDTFQLTVF